MKVSDVRQADQIVFECLELWSDPVAWQLRLLEQTADLLAMSVGVYAEVDTLEPGKIAQVFSVVEHGWEDRRQRERFTNSKKLMRAVPFSEQPLDVAWREAFVGQESSTKTRSDIVDCNQWESTEVYENFYEPVGLYESIRSAHRLPGGGVSIVNFATGRAPVPGARERELLTLIHRGVAVGYHDRLTRWTHVSALGLTPRQLDVLGHLVAGEAERTIALRLGRSTATINEHIQAIYRHFCVKSRAELMSYLLQRKPTPRSNPTPPRVAD